MASAAMRITVCFYSSFVCLSFHSLFALLPRLTLTLYHYCAMAYEHLIHLIHLKYSSCV